MCLVRMIMKVKAKSHMFDLCPERVEKSWTPALHTNLNFYSGVSDSALFQVLCVRAEQFS